MSRCVSCDKKLTHFELTRKSLLTGKYIDMCNHCYSFIKEDVPCKESTATDMFDEDEDEYDEN